MEPDPLTSRPRGTATPYSLGEFVVVVLSLSMVPLALLFVAAYPVAVAVGLGVLSGAAALTAVAPAVLRRLGRGRTQTMCVPSTDVCVDL